MVCLDEATKQQLLARLIFRKTNDKWGRVLFEAMPHDLNLPVQKWDRLLPLGSLESTHDLETAVPPLQLFWFRSSPEVVLQKYVNVNVFVYFPRLASCKRVYMLVSS